MKVLKLIAFLSIFFTASLSILADNKYILNDGDVHFGEKIAENDDFIRIREFQSNEIRDILKADIWAIQPIYLEIYKKDGYALQGLLVENTFELLTLKMQDETVSSIPKSEIRDINIIDEDNLHNLEAPYFDAKLKDNFALLGLNIGSPGMLNITAAYHLDDFIFQISGGAGDDMAGVEGDIFLNMYETDTHSFGLSLGLSFGYQREQTKLTFLNVEPYEKKYKYNQLGYLYSGGLMRIQLYGFIFQFGAAAPVLEDNPDVDHAVYGLVNLGYSFSFDL